MNQFIELEATLNLIIFTVSFCNKKNLALRNFCKVIQIMLSWIFKQDFTEDSWFWGQDKLSTEAAAFYWIQINVRRILKKKIKEQKHILKL